MPQERKTSGILLTAVIFILLEIAALAILRGHSTLQNIWINRASHRVQAALWGGGEKLRVYFLLQKENQELAARNAELQERIRQFQLREEALREAGSLVAVTGSERFRYTPATVVKMSRNSTHNYIILNKGYEDGIQPQSGIITDKGVVGIVSAVDRHYSYGITLMNSSLNVSARVGHTSLTAPLSWDGLSSDGAVIGDIAPHFEIAPGDTVWTSGFSSIFPPDVPIGTTGDSRLVDGATRQVDIRLFQDFATVRYVTIVENIERAEITALEKSEEEPV